MTVLAVFTVLAVLESTLPSPCSSYRTQCQETTVTVLTILAVSEVLAVSVVTATPLNSTPVFVILSNAAFTRTSAKSSRKLLPASLWHESRTQQNLFRKTCSDDLFFILGGFFPDGFPPLTV